MGSAVIARYICDRCGEEEEHSLDTFSGTKKPEGWLFFRLPARMPGQEGPEAALICKNCVTDFLGFMPTEPAPPPPPPEKG